MLDYVIYVSAAILIVLAVILMAKLGVTEQGFIKWFGLAFVSAFLYEAFIGDNRDRWKTKPFWVATTLALVVHFDGFVYLLMQIHYWRLVWFA